MNLGTVGLIFMMRSSGMSKIIFTSIAANSTYRGDHYAQPLEKNKS